jgi:heme-degrading monooxygenase HmoA
MLTFAWHETEFRTVEPERSYTALLGYVRLASVLILPRFAWYGRQIEKQLNRTTGLIGYRLGGRVLALEFFHLSAWENAQAVQAFVHEEPHQHIMKNLVGRLGKTEFRYWTVTGAELPLVFERELERLSGLL